MTFSGVKTAKAYKKNIYAITEQRKSREHAQKVFHKLQKDVILFNKWTCENRIKTIFIY